MINTEVNKKNDEATRGMLLNGLVGTQVGDFHIALVKDERPSTLQPIIPNRAFFCDLKTIPLPEQHGTATLYDAIQKALVKFGITYNKPLEARFTSSISALPGNYAEEDLNCTGMAEAKFLPMFNPRNQDKFAVILSYALNGETELGEDNLFVPCGEIMSCQNRVNKNEEEQISFKAIALEAKKHSRNVSHQNNRIMIVCMDYEHIMPDVEELPDSVRCVQQSTLGNRSVYDSHIMEGSHVIDDSIKIFEPGIRRLKEISVHLIEAKIINTKGESLTPSQCKAELTLMKKAVLELNQFSMLFKAFTYDNLVASISSHLLQYGIDTFKTNIFEHAMLRLGSINETPALCHYYKAEASSELFNMALNIAQETAITLVRNLQERFGTDFCILSAEQDSALPVIQCSLREIKKCFPAIQASMNEILSEPGHLLAYQNQSNKKTALVGAASASMSNNPHFFFEGSLPCIGTSYNSSPGQIQTGHRS